jgi:hypothetical protein
MPSLESSRWANKYKDEDKKDDKASTDTYLIFVDPLA